MTFDDITDEQLEFVKDSGITENTVAAAAAERTQAHSRSDVYSPRDLRAAPPAKVVPGLPENKDAITDESVPATDPAVPLGATSSSAASSVPVEEDKSERDVLTEASVTKSVGYTTRITQAFDGPKKLDDKLKFTIVLEDESKRTNGPQGVKKFNDKVFSYPQKQRSLKLVGLRKNRPIYL